MHILGKFIMMHDFLQIKEDKGKVFKTSNFLKAASIVCRVFQKHFFKILFQGEKGEQGLSKESGGKSVVKVGDSLDFYHQSSQFFCNTDQ